MMTACGCRSLLNLIKYWKRASIFAKKGKEHDFLRAVRAGEIQAAVQVLNTAGVDINCTNECGSTALLLAAIKGDVEMVQLLLDHGCDVNKSGPEDWTPLHGACFYGRTQVVQLLLAQNADLRAFNNRHKHPGDEFDNSVPYADALKIREIIHDAEIARRTELEQKEFDVFYQDGVLCDNEEEYENLTEDEQQELLNRSRDSSKFSQLGSSKGSHVEVYDVARPAKGDGFFNVKIEINDMYISK